MSTNYVRRRQLRRIESLAARNSNDLARLITSLIDGMEGHPRAQALQADRTSGHTTVIDDRGIPVPSVADPTGETAIRPDFAAKDRLEYDKCLEIAERAMERADRIRVAWTPTAPTLAKSTEEGDDGCELCARTVDGKGQARWSLPHVEASTVKGNLSRPYRLCRWCYDFVRSHGRAPTKAELNAYHTTGKLRQSA